MVTTVVNEQAARPGTFAPLKEQGPFRRIWIASIFSNFSQLFLGVGAAWEMTKLSNSPSMVALVQTAMMLPLMIVTLPAGAIADMFDKRKIALSGLGFSALSAAALTLVSSAGMITPWLLLAFCVLIGAGVALFSPSWQASIPEQVSRENLPSAVALGTISYNVARSFGPALGGLIVLAAGATAVFGLTTVFYAPLLFAFFMWKRNHVPSRLPPERIDRAIVGGGRYALNAPAIRTALVRVFLFGLMSATAGALAPLIAKDMLGGDAAIFGMLLGAQGIGAVCGALFVGKIRERFSTEWAIRIFAVGSGLSIIVIGLSHSVPLSCLAFAVIGVSNILTIAMLNVTVQMSAPRWVSARALSLFASAITAGIGIGAWGWGALATSHGVSFAFVASGLAVIATILFGFAFPLSRDAEVDISEVGLNNEPNVAMPLTLRSGPIMIALDYDVDPDKAREFYGAMMDLQGVRKRNGGFNWSLSRDVENLAIWTEHFYCPTWGDYLRMRARYSQTDTEIQAEADSFNRSGRRVRRRLVRPFGSVRWKADSPDPYHDTVGYIGP
ncbi:MAG TPA: MFS transporter [Novosphingobium sp.]|nr:MFS transporter [Novosphingobium sp.]